MDRMGTPVPVFTELKAYWENLAVIRVSKVSEQKVRLPSTASQEKEGVLTIEKGDSAAPPRRTVLRRQTTRLNRFATLESIGERIGTKRTRSPAVCTFTYVVGQVGTPSAKRRSLSPSAAATTSERAAKQDQPPAAVQNGTINPFDATGPKNAERVTRRRKSAVKLFRQKITAKAPVVVLAQATKAGTSRATLPQANLDAPCSSGIGKTNPVSHAEHQANMQNTKFTGSKIPVLKTGTTIFARKSLTNLRTVNLRSIATQTSPMRSFSPLTSRVQATSTLSSNPGIRSDLAQLHEARFPSPERCLAPVIGTPSPRNLSSDTPQLAKTPAGGPGLADQIFKTLALPLE